MKSIMFLLVVVSMLVSCVKDEGPFGILEIDINDTTQVISYSNDIQPIFNAYCVNCHNVSHNKLNLLSTASYIQITSEGFSAPYIDLNNPEGSTLYKSLKGIPTIMPPSGTISESDINKILLWIKKGALND